jgi:hypothetical protein
VAERSRLDQRFLNHLPDVHITVNHCNKPLTILRLPMIDPLRYLAECFGTMGFSAASRGWRFGLI